MAAGAKDSVTRKKSFSVSVVAVVVAVADENSCKSKMFSLSFLLGEQHRRRKRHVVFDEGTWLLSQSLWWLMDA